MVINMQKKGWIRIVEAFIAILLITSVLLITISKGYILKEDISSRVYDAQLSILREIELNDGLRVEIVEDIPTVPEGGINWDDGLFPGDVKDKITSRTPNYLNCTAKICEINKICVLDDFIDGDVYAQSVVISATSDTYSPKQLKLFCWTY